MRAAYHDVAPSGKGTPAEREPGIVTHDDGMAGGHPLEVLQVAGDVPGHPVALSDGAVGGFGYN